jgi:hypothetical protein
MNMHADQLLDLYWLGYLLTGDRERSVQAIIETLEMPDVANQFFEDWMVTRSRKIFIAKVLGYVVSKTRPSHLRARLRRLQSLTSRRFIRRIDPAAGKPELERALLAIESLPRCALLLSVFEKLSTEDIQILLNVDSKSIKTATAIGMIELAQNLARNQRSPFTRSMRDASFGAIEEMTA